MSARSLAPILAVLAAVLGVGCYSTPSTRDSGGADGSSAGGSGTPKGPLDDMRGQITDGDFSVYWRHYDSWDGGACVELLLRNQGTASARVSELRIEALDSLTYWADSGGAVFWPDGNQITIWPESTSLSGGGIRRMYYCAEPATELLSLEVDASRGTSSGGDDAGTDGGDTAAPEVNAGTFTQEGLVLNWREMWEDPEHGGTCFEFAAFNETSLPIDLGAIRFEMSGEFEITHSYGLTPTPVTGGLAILFPDYLGSLPPLGEPLSDQFRGTVCFDPVVVPMTMTADID